MGGLPLRIELPAGLAAVIGALPVSVRARLPELPSAPPVVLGASDAVGDLVGSPPVEEMSAVALGVIPFLSRLRGRLDPVLRSVTGPVTLDLELRRGGSSDAEAGQLAIATVERVAGRLVELTARILPGAPVLLFLQEP